jgi:hypothetical protein
MLWNAFFSSKVSLLGGSRMTKWLVCAYLSPTERLVKCVDGFVSSEEKVRLQMDKLSPLNSTLFRWMAQV